MTAAIARRTAPRPAWVWQPVDALTIPPLPELGCIIGEVVAAGVVLRREVWTPAGGARLVWPASVVECAQ